ncbi:hypothetical protein GBAR_LOCUS27341 [Geodia barretti]|uniref:Uncharacterized protein n=1 Tax=Geodia barretti TaxID=519541 RepID=A0AA35X8S5_GEOBA|nr:hypothetical protein GBAR_LOCUS27341 [Geodia barretti]
MKLVLQGLVLLLAGVRLRVSCASEDVAQCPTWKWFNYSSGVCQCGHDIMGTIKCSEAENSSVYARFDVCVSWDSHSQTVLTSLCKFKRSRSTSVTDRVFSALPQSPYNLSFDECELNNREGVFCGGCKKGFAPTLHTFSGKCIDCNNCLQNPASLFLFLASEILPLTIFYLIIMKLRINIVSGPLLGYVIFCQCHINAVHIYPNIWRFLLASSESYVRVWNTMVLLPLTGIWNINFFAMFMPHLCYGCGFNYFFGLLIQYLSVLYIFVLVFLGFLIDSLDLKSKLSSVRFCRIMIFSLVRFRRDWSLSDSAIHALATFTALFVAKVIAISDQLLSARKVYNMNGTLVKKVLTFEPSIEALSSQHAPYAVAAYVPIFIFVLIPTLVLCLHPSRHFQNLLARCCGPRKRLALAIFVDTISSGYRDGLDGGRDWRRIYPLSFSFIAATLFFLANFFTNLPETYFIILLPVFLCLSFCVLYFRPCKTKAMNASLSFHFIMMALVGLTLALWIQDYFLSSFTLEIFLTVCLTLPHVVMLLWLLSNIVQRCQSLRNCCYVRQNKFLLGFA